MPLALAALWRTESPFGNAAEWVCDGVSGGWRRLGNICHPSKLRVWSPTIWARLAQTLLLPADGVSVENTT